MVEVAQLKHFLKEKYTRNLVLKTENVEILVVCWLPGQGSQVHDHGKSDGIIFIVEGQLSYTNIYPDGRKVSGVVEAGHLNHTPVGVKHQIANHSQQELVTLHIYAPPLEKGLQGFDLGYSNDISLNEVQLPQETISFVMGVIPQQALADLGAEI